MARSDVRKRLGARLRRLRTQVGLTQERLAERANLTPTYVSALERGVKSASIETLASLARGLGMTMSEMLVGVDADLPQDIRRVETALAGQPPEAQRVVLDIVGDALRLCTAARRTE